MLKIGQLVQSFNALLAKIPESAIALLARFSIAAIFWKSGQTKIEGFAIDIVSGRFEFGWPQFSDSLYDLFEYEYQLPIISAQLAGQMAAIAEHLFPTLILFGLATRWSALALLGMTAVIQIFVYPDAYPTHGVWAVTLLYLITRGGGRIAVDHYIANWFSKRI